jgi:hypothetical protein
MSGAWTIRACALALVLTAACGETRAPQTPPVTAAPPVAEAAPDPALRQYEGSSYAELIAASTRYAPANLGLTPAAQARFERGMSQTAPAWIVEGGGTEALVIVGCDAAACVDAAAVLAIDLATGAPFAAVRDARGREVLVAQDRLEALVEATSPADRWDDPEAWDASPGAAAPTP